MSYQIIYRGFAVKTSKGSFLMIENGSNNCYFADGSRERVLWTLNIFEHSSILFKDADDAISHLNHDFIDGGGVKMCRGKFESFIKRCFKNSVDIKELLDGKWLYLTSYDVDERETLFDRLTTEDEVLDYLGTHKYPMLYCNRNFLSR